MFRFIFVSCFVSGTLLAAPPHFVIKQPKNQTIDQTIQITVKDLEPLQHACIHAQAQDDKGTLWESNAYFQANDEGYLDLSTSKPLEGSSYEAADTMGLFWSMLPSSGNDTLSFKCREDYFSVEMELIVNGRLVETQTILRYLQTPQVEKQDIREQGLVASLFIPKTDKPLPVIITLSGSNGGLGENRAKLLASNDFAVLALGYFGVDGLASNLQDIPFEYFETALTWLQSRPNVDSSRIGLYGVSRGGELSLLLGSFFQGKISAIVAALPSSVVYAGLGKTPVNAWIYRGKPLVPFAPVPQTDFTGGRGQTQKNPANTRESFLEGMKDEAAFAAAAISVENIHCPILLISAGDDQMWPSELYATQIVTRLQEKGSEIEAIHLNYPDAGHGIGLPNLPTSGPIYYHPVGKLWFSMGGSREADAKASRESWSFLVNFFHQHLQAPKTPSN